MLQNVLAQGGGWLAFPASPTDRQVLPLGQLPGLRRFTACHRYEPFWMNPVAGTDLSALPTEVKYLLCQLEDETWAVLVPWVDGLVSCALQGDANGLALVAETGDPAVPLPAFRGLFVGTGPEPFSLLEESAVLLRASGMAGRLRLEKDVPDFTDTFGWCTWDAFYADVSMEKVREGLESFAAGGVTPRYMILDDGWLSTRKDEDGSERLTSFAANGKFPGGLAPTIQMAKEEFGLDQVLVWHAMTGYWGGVDPSMGYGSKIGARKSSPGVAAHVGEIVWWGPSVGVVPASEAYRFFQDFHRGLREQGVDGVKVDVQAQLELVPVGSGGKVPLMHRYHEALEGSVQVHFQGNLINCMSCASEMIYGAPASNLTRTSTDFWPNKPESHGLHLYCNAQVSAWFGEFIQPDWDMFQSGHPAGAYHAAGRAVSGGPVYVSDKPGAHNFEVLQSLVMEDGSVLRALRPGRPTADCILHDPTKEDVLLKIQNLNPAGGVIGAFNARYGGEGNPIAVSGQVRPSDVAGLEGELFAVHAFSSGEVRALGRDEAWPITLPELGWEVFTIVPIQDGFAPIGLEGKLNGGGAVLDWSIYNEVLVSHGGTLLAYSQEQPTSVLNEDGELDWSWEGQVLRVEVPEDSSSLRVVLEP